MELIVYAPVWGQSGFEQLSRGLLLALDQMGVNIELRDAGEWNQERLGLPQETVSRLARMTQTRVSPNAPHVLYQIPKGQPVQKDSPTICYTLFETDRCPVTWIESLKKMDKIFVFSKFNFESWIKSGIPEEKISALPPAVDSFFYHPDGPRYQILNRKGFTFLMSGDFTERKNFEAVIEAFTKEFKEQEPVTLIVKTHYGGFTKRYRRDCASRLKTMVRNFAPQSSPRVLFYGDKISDHAMAALYRSVDCFVLASRGEGLGMQYLEAMASGVPVIACDWGAQTDYMDPSCGYLISSYLKTIDDPNYILKCPQALNSQWCQVQINDLRSAMRHIVENYSEAKEKASRALDKVRSMTWHGMAQVFIKEIINMYSKKREEVPA